MKTDELLIAARRPERRSIWPRRQELDYIRVDDFRTEAAFLVRLKTGAHPDQLFLQHPMKIDTDDEGADAAEFRAGGMGADLRTALTDRLAMTPVSAMKCLTLLNVSSRMDDGPGT